MPKPNARMAYVALATPDYDLGLRVLLRSLRRTSQIPVFVLVPSRWTLQTEVADVFAIAAPHIVREFLVCRDSVTWSTIALWDDAGPRTTRGLSRAPFLLSFR